MEISKINVMKLIGVLIAVASLSSCVALDSSFLSNTGTRTNACNIDLSIPVELERAKFVPPEFWSRLKQCESVKISKHPRLDSWEISATLYYTYADVLVYDTAMGFGVEGSLNLIGDTPTTMEDWKLREVNKWEKYIKNKGYADKQIFKFETRKRLKCWKVTTKSFDDGYQSALSIAYNCWQPGKFYYPPIRIAGSVRYWNGKPVYDLDIDKDLIDPVFATLVVKDIKPEVYAERMAIHDEKIRQECKRRLKTVKKNPGREFSAYYIERLEFCGYDTSKLKREER